MPDEYLANPWELDDGGSPVTDGTALDTPAVAGAGGAPASPPRIPNPGPIMLTRPRVCKQPDDSRYCWAAALASWRAILGRPPVTGVDSYPNDPELPLDFDIYARPFTEKYKSWLRQDKSFNMKHFYDLAKAEQFDYIEVKHKFLEGTGIVPETISHLLKIHGHIYLWYFSENLGHCIVIWKTDNVTSEIHGTTRLTVIAMDPWNGNDHQNLSEFIKEDSNITFAFAGTGIVRPWPDVKGI